VRARKGHRSAPISVNFEDISMLSDEEQDATIDRWLDDEKCHPSDERQDAENCIKHTIRFTKGCGK